MTAVAVLGAGISGLVAAYRLRRTLGPSARILLVDDADRDGGKLRTVDIGDVPVDVGAEAFVARRPEMPALLVELGLSDLLVRPSATARPLVRSGGALHPLPVGTLMGIPASAESVAHLVDAATVARIEAEATTPFRWTPGHDASLGDLISERFGPQVTARSVDPLLGGVYSGLSVTTGVRAALPGLAAALDAGATSLTDAVLRARPAPTPGPVFGGLRGGYRPVLEALAAEADAERVVTRVGSVTRAGSEWTVDGVGVVDAVVVALPAPAAAAALATFPTLADRLGAIELASSAVVALRFDGVDLPDNSGVLVATGELRHDGEPLRAKAFTLSSRKWPHLADRGGELVRASLGRYGDAAIVDEPDGVLIDSARRDLADVLGVDTAPTAAVVQRWYGGLPQYRPGHLDVVADLEAAAADLPRLELAGAYLHGVGVPACVAVASAAAERTAAALA